ncbi:ribosomal L7Ae/L30e/S12e/Gadd45 family protein [Nanoarchaeota archaeon]
MADLIAEIKKNLKEEKLIIGADRTLKGLRIGQFVKVYLASNCAAELKEDIDQLAGLGEVEVAEVPLVNTELGDLCKKPFSISVMGLLK